MNNFNYVAFVLQLLRRFGQHLLKIADVISVISTQVERYGPYTVNLRDINGPYSAVISGAKIRSYHSEVAAHIRPHILNIRHRIQYRITVPKIARRYGPYTAKLR